MILDKIIKYKKAEVERNKTLIPIALLEESIYFQSPCISLVKYLLREDKHGIIAEIKRKSPSRGIINPNINVEEVSIGYMQAGASALSVLTDEPFFGGQKQDLVTARKFNYCPILRKDFIINEYQIFESRSWGADVVLLIAAALKPNEYNALADKAHSMGMEVLLEVHSEQEINTYDLARADVIGVNNRDLQSFDTSLETSIRLASLLPSNKVRISESGIESAGDIQLLRSCGYKGFLIGGSFMKSGNPQETCQNLIDELENLKLQETCLS